MNFNFNKNEFHFSVLISTESLISVETKKDSQVISGKIVSFTTEGMILLIGNLSTSEIKFTNILKLNGDEHVA